MKEPKIIEIERIDGTIGKFEIRQFSCMDAMRFITTFPSSIALSSTKIGNYALSEKIIIEMMGYVSVIIEDDIKIPLGTKELIDNHVGDFTTLHAILREMFDFNTGFFANGNHLDLIKTVIKSVTKALAELSIEMSPNLSDK